MNTLKIIFIILSVYLGGMMIYGSFGKFSQEGKATPIEVIEKAQAYTSPAQNKSLQRFLYIEGMKQTGYAWYVLGIAELVLGLMIVFQKTRFLGAIFLIPVTLHIFLFHLFLEPHELGELINTAILFVINIALIIKEYPKWQHLVYLNKL